MDRYLIWFDPADSHRDLELASAVHDWLEHLRQASVIEGWSLTRRKLGFGPAELGEFQVEIRVRNLSQLDLAFGQAAARSGPAEDLHRAVYSRVKNFKSALYRDFPDPQRAG